MDWKPGPDMYIGLSMGFLLILFAAFIIGFPLRDLAILTVLFIVVGTVFVQILKHRQNRR